MLIAAACRVPVTAGCAVSTSNSHPSPPASVGSVNATSPGRCAQHDQKRVSGDRAPLLVDLSDRPAVEQHAQGLTLGIGPVRVTHLATSAVSHSTSARSPDRPSQEGVAPKNGLGPAQCRHRLHELKKSLRVVVERPGRPRELRVVTVGVVVATLRSAEFIAATRSSARRATPSASAGSCGGGVAEAR